MQLDCVNIGRSTDGHVKRSGQRATVRYDMLWFQTMVPCYLPHAACTYVHNLLPVHFVQEWHLNVNTNNFIEALNRALKIVLSRAPNRRVDALLEAYNEEALPSYNRRSVVVLHQDNACC